METKDTLTIGEAIHLLDISDEDYISCMYLDHGCYFVYTSTAGYLREVTHSIPIMVATSQIYNRHRAPIIRVLN